MNCSIAYGGETYEANVTGSLGGITSISFTQPDSLNGFVYTFTPDECRVSYGDLTLSSDASKLSSKALPQLICDLLRDISENDLVWESGEKGNSSTAVYSGNLNGSHYSVTTDHTTGALRKISSKALTLTITFAPDETETLSTT